MTFSAPITAYLASLPELTIEKIFGTIYIGIILIYYPLIQRLIQRRAEQDVGIRCAYYVFLIYLWFMGRYCADAYLVCRYLCQLGLVDSDPTNIELFSASQT
jgi:hypothetical protein